MHQFRGVIFLSCIEEIECRLGLFATIHVVKLYVVGREAYVTDAHGEVFIVVHHFTVSRMGVALAEVLTMMLL